MANNNPLNVYMKKVFLNNVFIISTNLCYIAPPCFIKENEKKNIIWESFITESI